MADTEVYLYVLGSNSDPNNVANANAKPICSVPWHVKNSKLIFFGPCEKKLRRNFNKRFLIPEKKDEVTISDKAIYLVGVNALKGLKKKERKIVWAGKMKKIMTFENAYNDFIKKDKFKTMIKDSKSPLHVEPIPHNSTTDFKGYQSRSTLHNDKKSKGKWKKDITSSKRVLHKNSKSPYLKVTSGNQRWDDFKIDCCFLLEKIFFAKGQGIEINDGLLNILKKKNVQGRRHHIDNVAVFGKGNGKTIGLRGGFLPLIGPDAESFINLIKQSAAAGKPIKINNTVTKGVKQCCTY